MTKSKKKYNTKKVLIISIPIAFIFFAIAWNLGSRTIGVGDINRKVKSEIVMLEAAVKLYEVRYGELPKNKSGMFDFAERLSNIPISSGLPVQRSMYIDFKRHNIKVSNENYAVSNATPTKVYDLYGSVYFFRYLNEKNFEIISNGPDQKFLTDDDIILKK